MGTLLDFALLVVIATLCRQGYQQRKLWFTVPVQLFLRLGRGRGFAMQLLIYGAPTVAGLLLCHWINTHGWHATAAGGILIGMMVGMEAMRIAEEEQKWRQKQCDTELEQ
ncbi:MAG: hypothetical protein R8J85_03055 [Mariprofundales bacterium]